MDRQRLRTWTIRIPKEYRSPKSESERGRKRREIQNQNFFRLFLWELTTVILGRGMSPNGSTSGARCVNLTQNA